MGRATNRSGGNRSSGNSNNNNNNRSASSSVVPTSEFAPGYPPNLKRSLERNDVELAALSKLHVAIRALKKAIVEEFGEDILLERVVEEGRKVPVGRVGDGGEAGNEKEQGGAGVVEEETKDAKDNSNDDDNKNDASPPPAKDEETNEEDAKQKRLRQLTTAFLLRMKLRRRLLNRLARRLHRVAHIMDGTSSSAVTAPLPPLYGDVVRRYVKEEAEKSGLAAKLLGGSLSGVEVIREGDLEEFLRKERRRTEVKDVLEGNRRRRGLVEDGDDKEKQDETKADSNDDKEEMGDEEKKTESESMEENKESNDDGDQDESMDEVEAKEPESMDVDSEDTESSKDEAEVEVEDAAPNTEASLNTTDVDLLLQGDEEDKPLLDQLAEYEPGYDKMYSIGPMPLLPPPTSNPSTTASPNDKAEEKGDVKVEEKDDVKMEDNSDAESEKSEDKANDDGESEDEVDVKSEDEDDAKSEDEVDEMDEDEAPAAADEADEAADDEPTATKDIEASSPVAPDATNTPSTVAEGTDKNDPHANNNINDLPSKEKQILKMTMPIALTTDTHEVDDEGEFLQSSTPKTEGENQPPQSRLPFSLYSSSTRMLQPKERAAEWKRWTKEMCEKIPDQVTFDELGVGGAGMVFDLEGRLKRKREQEEKEKKNVLIKEKELVKDEHVIRGKGGKVLRKSSPDDDDSEDDGDAKIDEADKEAKDKEAETDNKKKDAKEKKQTAQKDVAPKKSTKSFSVTPVPSFHYQDLKRIRILQNEMVNHRNVQRNRERIFRAQDHYDKTYKLSIDLQQAKATALADYSKLSDKFNREAAAVKQRGRIQERAARYHWQNRQFQLKDMRTKLGDEEALVRTVTNDALQDMKDRVTIRTAEGLKGSGLGTHRLEKVAAEAKREGDENKAVAATMLGHMIDSVERCHYDALADSPTFVPPQVATAEKVIADPKTGESMADFHKREKSVLKRKIAGLDSEFKDAEKKRGKAWLALGESKGGTRQPTSSAASASKPRPKSRRSAGGGTSSNYRLVPTAANNAASGAVPAAVRSTQSYPTQQMQHATAAQQRQQATGRPTGAAVPRGVPLGYVQLPYYQPRQVAASSLMAQNTGGPITAASIMAARNAVAAHSVVAAAAQNARANQLISSAAVLAAARGYVPQQQPNAQQQQIAQMRSLVAANLVQQQVVQQQQQRRPANVVGARVVLQSSSGRGRGAQFHPVQRQAPAILASVPPGLNIRSQPPVSVQPAALAAAAMDPSDPNQKTPSLAKYGYGDKYSINNVNARKNPDGTVVPASKPKLLPNGQFARPAGRQRKGMDWDAVRGYWFPIVEGQQQQGGGGQGGGGN